MIPIKLQIRLWGLVIEALVIMMMRLNGPPTSEKRLGEWLEMAHRDTLELETLNLFLKEE